jgi:deazaflavin-dependent oxidoreductase (nitroreductase family)
MTKLWTTFLFWCAASKAGVWLMQAFLAPLDPLIYKLTHGKCTTAGPVVIPQLVLTTIGRKSGVERCVQLAYTDIDGAILIVASNFGGKSPPAWSYNLGATPQATVQLGARTFHATAVQLSAPEKDAVWDRLVANIPNYAVYQTRTARHLKVYRLDEVDDFIYSGSAFCLARVAGIVCGYTDASRSLSSAPVPCARAGIHSDASPA